MELKYVDAHCHVQFGEYGADRDELIGRMRERGVGGLVVGCDLASSREAVELAGGHDHLWAAVGQHPNTAPDEEFDEPAYRNLLMYPRVVAIGECGLDYFRPKEVTEEVKEKQKALFKRHVELASATDRPLVIHCRPSKGTMDAYADLMVILKEANAAHGRAVRGDVHFFVGGIAEMRELVALGFTVSYTAVVTFAREYDAAIRAAPLGSLLAETDSPFVAPRSRRGERNDPLAVEEVAAKIAEVRGEEPEAVREALLANTLRLFALGAR